MVSDSLQNKFLENIGDKKILHELYAGGQRRQIEHTEGRMGVVGVNEVMWVLRYGND
jgi:hypothetical protein